MTVCCTAGPLFVSAGNGWPRDALRYHWFLPISCHFQDCKSASGHESDSCVQRCSKYPTFTFLPARRYASAGLCDSDVSVCLSVFLTRQK